MSLSPAHTARPACQARIVLRHQLRDARPPRRRRSGAETLLSARDSQSMALAALATPV